MMRFLNVTPVALFVSVVAISSVNCSSPSEADGPLNGGGTGNDPNSTADGAVTTPGADGGTTSGGDGSTGTTVTPDGGNGTSVNSTPFDVMTFQYGNMRQGWNSHETALTPAVLSSKKFGKIASATTDGVVTGQPLYLAGVDIPGSGKHNVVYVATDSNGVYAFDADTGSQIWYTQAMNAGEKVGHGCPSFLDKIGISATPVIDRSQGANGAIYVTPMVTDASNKTHQRIMALDVATGAALFGGAKDVAPSYTSPSSSAMMTMDPENNAEVAALTLVNGVVYTSWGNPCEYVYNDHGGWVVGFNASSLDQTSVWNTTPEGNGGIIWMGAGAPAADSQGNLYYPTGQGSFDDTKGNYANSVVKLSTAGNKLAVADFFHSTSAPQVDFDWQGTMLFDAVDNAGATHHLLSQNQGGDLYIVDTENMGKSGMPYQYMVQGDYGGGYNGGPAFFNGQLYYTGQWDPMRAFTTPDAKVTFRGDQPPDAQGTGTPSVSSNGTSDGILWKVDRVASPDKQLFHAYNPADISKVLYSSEDNAARDGLAPPTMPNLPQNSSLTVTSGKVYVPDSQTHGLAIYGILP